MDGEWQLRWVWVPKGTHLSKSRVTPGADKTLLLEDGTNRTLGPTESYPADEDSLPVVYVYDTLPDGPYAERRRQAVRDAADILVAELAVPAAEVVAAKVKQAAAKGTEMVRAKTAKKRPLQGEVLPAASPETEVATRQPTAAVSSARFRELLIEALVAERFAHERWKTLADARVVDGDLSPHLRDAIRAALEGNASAVDRNLLMAAVDFLADRELPAALLPSSQDPPPGSSRG